MLIAALIFYFVTQRQIICFSFIPLTKNQNKITSEWSFYAITKIFSSLLTEESSILAYF